MTQMRKKSEKLIYLIAALFVLGGIAYAAFGLSGAKITPIGKAEDFRLPIVTTITPQRMIEVYHEVNWSIWRDTLTDVICYKYGVTLSCLKGVE